MTHPIPSSNSDHISDSIAYSDWQPYSYERAGAVKFVKLMRKLFNKNPAKSFSYDHRLAGFYRRAGSNIEIRTRVTTSPGGKIPGPSEIWPPGFQVDISTAKISVHHDPAVSDSVHVTGVALVNNKI
jgi:hypothetical protein